MSLSKLWELMINTEAWHAAVHRVAKSLTRLSDWTELNWLHKLKHIFPLPADLPKYHFISLEKAKAFSFITQDFGPVIHRDIAYLQDFGVGMWFSFFWWIWFGRDLICHFLIVSEYTKHLNFSTVSLIPWVLRLLLEHAPQTSICFIYPPYLFLKKKCGPFSKSLLNLLQYCFCFMFWYFGREACGILAPPPWISHPPPALESKVLTTGLPGKVKVTQSCPTLCNPMDHTIHGNLQARILEWVAFPFSRESSQPRHQTQVLPLQAESLLAEPQGKPKNIGVGSLSLLQWIFLTQESNQGLLHYRQILYQLSS